MDGIRYCMFSIVNIGFRVLVCGCLVWGVGCLLDFVLVTKDLFIYDLEFYNDGIMNNDLGFNDNGMLDDKGENWLDV